MPCWRSSMPRCGGYDTVDAENYDEVKRRRTQWADFNCFTHGLKKLLWLDKLKVGRQIPLGRFLSFHIDFFTVVSAVKIQEIRRKKGSCASTKPEVFFVFGNVSELQQFTFKQPAFFDRRSWCLEYRWIWIWNQGPCISKKKGGPWATIRHEKCSPICSMTFFFPPGMFSNGMRITDVCYEWCFGHI